VAKFRRVTPLSPKVIKAQMLNFEPIFDHFVKIVGGAPISGGVHVSKTWPFCNVYKNFGAEI